MKNSELNNGTQLSRKQRRNGILQSERENGNENDNKRFVTTPIIHCGGISYSEILILQ